MDATLAVDTESPAAAALFEHRAAIARDAAMKVYDLLCPGWAQADQAETGGVFHTRLVVSPCVAGIAFALANIVWDTALPSATPEEAMSAVMATFTTALAECAEQRGPGRLLEAATVGHA